MSVHNKNKTHLGRPVPPKIKISAKGLFLQNDIYDRLKFAYAVAPRDTIRAFKEVGIVITSPDDLIVLANIHASGNDVSGFTMRDGKTYAFNVREILNRPRTHPKSIKMSTAMYANAPIEWTDMVVHRGKVKIIR